MAGGHRNVPATDTNGCTKSEPLTLLRQSNVSQGYLLTSSNRFELPETHAEKLHEPEIGLKSQQRQLPLNPQNLRL